MSLIARCLVVNTSDSGSRGRGFELHSGCRVVSLSKTYLPPQKVLVIPKKRWLHPNMTEKLVTGTLSIKPNEIVARKPVFGVSTRSNTNRAVQPLRLARGLKFVYRKKWDCTIYVAKIKALISCAVFCFCISEKPVFL